MMVGDDQFGPGLHQVSRHGLAHQAQTDEADGRSRKIGHP
jgi:hypothetical protein